MVQFEDGGRFYTDDGYLLDELCPPDGQGGFNIGQWVSRFERHKHAVLLSVVLLIGFLFFGYRYGIPAVADSLAGKLPQSTLVLISDNTLDTLDKFLALKPTTMDEADQERLQQLFDELVAAEGSPEYSYSLDLRRFGVNAFALPSGRIVVGEELVHAMPNEDAVLAVLAHEVAHVQNRHGVRQLLRSAGVGFLIGSVFGDLGAGAGVFSALPELLMTSNYSRSFETDADLFAADYMRDVYGNTNAMVQALERLAEEVQDVESKPVGWISSHPLTRQRIDDVRNHLKDED